jgi:alpha-tubulin suppressor-like RCC1 family protein
MPYVRKPLPYQHLIILALLGLLALVSSAGNGYAGDGYSWGYNPYGQLGDGTNTNRDVPVQVLGPGGSDNLAGVVAVGGGFYFTVALKSDGTVWTWGRNEYGQLGDGTNTTRTVPVQVLGPGGVGYLTGIVAISGGYEHTIARKSDGTVWSWGANSAGQLGDGTGTNRNVPVQVLGPGSVGYLTRVVAVSGCGSHTVALKTDGTVWTWGWGPYGQLGTANNSNQYVPVQVLGPGGDGYLTDVVAVGGGYNNTFGLKTDGTVWAWGGNDFGQLGDGSNTNRNVPVQVQGPGGVGFLSDVTAVSQGMYHTVALKSDGTLWAWGYNGVGQNGDGTFMERDAPVQVLGPGGVGYLTDIVGISGGNGSTTALKSDGTVWAWGYGGNGQLGQGSMTNANDPVQVLGLEGASYLTGVMAISGSTNHTIAVIRN